jgi:hypothetical protein
MRRLPVDSRFEATWGEQFYGGRMAALWATTDAKWRNKITGLRPTE